MPINILVCISYYDKYKIRKISIANKNNYNNENNITYNYSSFVLRIILYIYTYM